MVISSDSAHLPIVLNPQVVHTSKPSTAGPAAPSPSATSVAAAEAAAAAAGGSAYTGPVVKAVSDVKAGDSCVCWSPDWCTCGWQACPFDPLDAVAAAAQLSDSAQRLFGADVLPQLQLSADAAVGRVAPPLRYVVFKLRGLFWGAVSKRSVPCFGARTHFRCSQQSIHNRTNLL